MKVLVACEESQRTTEEFRKLGHEAYSCDLMDCSGGHPEWHIKGDCLHLLDGGVSFTTMDNAEHTIDGEWDLIIAHPPCTYLTVSGNRWFNVEKYGENAIDRFWNRLSAIEFVLKIAFCKCKHIAIENPIGILSGVYRKPDQIIQPWMFGDPFPKSTCLWLKGLPQLIPEVTEAPKMEYKEWVDKNGRKKRQGQWDCDALSLSAEERQKERSKTFQGIARAFAEQWGPAISETPDEEALNMWK